MTDDLQGECVSTTPAKITVSNILFLTISSD